ncbi:MAG: sialidase family protein [Planctomycetaceae bacterium]
MDRRESLRWVMLVVGVIVGDWQVSAGADAQVRRDATAVSQAGDGPTIVTVAQSSPAYTRRSEGDSIELADGRLLLISMEFSGNGSDFAKTRFVAHESADLGRTWRGPRVVATTDPGDMNIYSPNLIRGRDGSILLAFMRQHRAGELTNHVWKSTDEGETFQPFATLAPRSDLALCNGTIKRLASGRLLLPASPPAPGRPAETGPYAAAVLSSDDDARTWRVSAARIELPLRGAMEPHVEEAADGRVLMVLRSQTGRVQLCESKDEGETWSLPRALELQAPESCPDLVRIPGTDHLLLVWNNSYDPKFRSHFGKRSPLSLAVSSDNGQTWRHIADVETDPRRAFSNPGLRFTKAGHGLLNYWTCEYLPDWAMQDVIDLRLARLDKEWLARLVTPR